MLSVSMHVGFVYPVLQILLQLFKYILIFEARFTWNSFVYTASIKLTCTCTLVYTVQCPYYV